MHHEKYYVVISRAHELAFFWVYVITGVELPLPPPSSESPSKSTSRSSQKSICFLKHVYLLLVDSQHTTVSYMKEVDAA